MVPLAPTAARYVRSWLGPSDGRGLLALRHALAYQLPGLWGDDPSTPHGVILIREGDGQLEAFGAGDPEPAVSWLVGHLRRFTLFAPETWLEPVQARVGEVEQDTVETWSGPALSAGAPRVATRRLTSHDSTAFAASVPAWGLRGWWSYSALMEHGIAFGVPHGSGFASLAWVFDQADDYDSVGVFTMPRFRRLGLGQAAATALVGEIVHGRGQVPLWSTAPGNTPARALAGALGFAIAATEPLLHWPSRNGKQG